MEQDTVKYLALFTLMRKKIKDNRPMNFSAGTAHIKENLQFKKYNLLYPYFTGCKIKF